jgi:hypothetical protein
MFGMTCVFGLNLKMTYILYTERVYNFELADQILPCRRVLGNYY